jgi:hypothetical protein
MDTLLELKAQTQFQYFNTYYAVILLSLLYNQYRDIK